MSVVDDRLDARDLALLARMHVEALPGSLVTLVGERYARRFYRYLSRSSEELVVTERQGGQLAGACIVSLEPASLSVRLLMHTSLLLHAPFALARLPLARLVAGTRAPAAAPAQPPGPEILLIFTVPSARSQGLGARLLARTEALLGARGLPRLLVKTRDEAENRAIGFYQREGFTRLASLEKLGKRLVLFDKALP